jgi:hypothetical protein
MERERGETEKREGERTGKSKVRWSLGGREEEMREKQGREDSNQNMDSGPSPDILYLCILSKILE